ncbi:putative glycoside hydrolase [Lachnospiraceae bacterium OttesenSCG-928-J05]|nr:putative glycoside hydrolase [Lachnospiraceae bacterium OttesenSCG-928-J05]
MSTISYRQVHLDFHTSEFIPSVGEAFSKEEFGETLERANVNSITCFGRCHHGWLYYPSKRFPELIHPHLQNKNLLLEQIETCHKRGIRVPIYTTAQWDGRIMREHPEWLALDENGEYIDTQNVPAPHFYHTICLNSGYRQFFKDQLVDMIEVVGPSNVDGIFIDILFQVDCKCPNCVAKMMELDIDTEDKGSRIRYASQMLEGFKEEVTNLIKELAPAATVFYNSSHIGPAYKKSFKDYSHLELESLPSGGWGYDHFPATSRYARMLGKEMIGMTGKFHTYWGDFHSLKNKAALELECFNMLAMGAGCSIGDQLHPSGKLSKGAYDLIGDIYRSVKEKEPYCFDAKARTEIGVLNPEEFYPEDSYDLSISPSLIGTVRMLQELCYQFDIIDTEMDFSKYKVLILPDCIYGNEKLEKLLVDYLEKGGKVLGSYESCLKKDGSPSIYGVKFQKESGFYREYVMPNEKMGVHLPKEEFVMYLRGLDVERDGAEVLMDKIEPYFDRSGDKFCSHQHAPSSGKVGAPEATLYRGALYFSHPIFRCYRKNAAAWCKAMVKDALELLLPDKMIAHDGPSTLQVTMNHQAKEDRDVLHLLHYITEKRSEDIYTIEDVISLMQTKFRIYVGDRMIKTVTNVIRGEELVCTRDGEYIEFTVPVINGHEMITIQ